MEIATFLTVCFYGFIVFVFANERSKPEDNETTIYIQEKDSENE